MKLLQDGAAEVDVQSSTVWSQLKDHALRLKGNGGEEWRLMADRKVARRKIGMKLALSLI